MKVRIGNYRSEKSKKPRIEKIEVHPWDTYSAYHTLGLIIYPVLVAYRQDIVDKEIVPADFLKPVDVSDKTEEEAQEIHEKLHDEALAEWLAILDKIIWAFEQIKDDFRGEHEFFKINENEDIDDLESRFDIDKDGLNDYYEQIDEGLQLFARYYRSLWW